MGAPPRAGAAAGVTVGAAGGGVAERGAPLLRRATRDDVAAIAAIERRAFSDPWSPQGFASLLEAPDVYLVVSEVAGRVTGYVVARYVADEGEIANIAVAPEARGHGLGGVLLDAALREASVRGVVMVYLEVRRSNDVARRLYASRGFREVGIRKGYYRHPVEDALVLRCTLPENR